METKKPYSRVETNETDDKYRLYVPIVPHLMNTALNLFPKFPLTSGEMYHAMTVFNESITRKNIHAKQLYEEARRNLGDESYAKSAEGQWERAALCVGKTGRILWDDNLVPVQLKSLKAGEIYVKVRADRCDYSGGLSMDMTVEAIIDTFERSEN